MGFLSGLFGGGSILGKIAGIAAAPFTGGTSLWATLGSTALDIGSKLWANKQAEDAQSTAWGRTMNASNTSYQRAVADMRAAGLNPILAYSQGGASTPTAQAASTAHLTDMGSRPVANALQLSQVANTNQQTRTSAALERLQGEQAIQTRLNNEGLAAMPPEYRAMAQMAGSTGLDVLNTGKMAARGIGHLSKSVSGAARGVGSKILNFGRKLFTRGK